PVLFNTYTANAGFAQTRLRIGYSADVTARRQEYQAVPLVGGGLAQQSERNNNSYEVALRPYYELVPNYQAFLRGAYNVRDYDHSVIGQPVRDSHGYRADIGARIDLTGLAYGEFFVGYLRQEYRSSTFGSIGGLDAGANIVYNITQLTSLTLKGARTAQDTNFAIVGAAPSPGYLESSVGLSIDHELLRNLLINGTAAYLNDDFKGIDRTDKVYQAGVGAKYLLSRNLYVGGNYTFQRRISSGTSGIGPFSRNIFLLRVSTQL
ncbi:MAG TPA: outer membrane beta-barrel protein, partial [Stellaceae bacterium]|nr:outer membrane beta-barrel protein [Stellaceae bacterium]